MDKGTLVTLSLLNLVDNFIQGKPVPKNEEEFKDFINSSIKYELSRNQRSESSKSGILLKE